MTLAVSGSGKEVRSTSGVVLGEDGGMGGEMWVHSELCSYGHTKAKLSFCH